MVDDERDSSELLPGLLESFTSSKVENLLMDVPFAYTGFQWRGRKPNTKIIKGRGTYRCERLYHFLIF